MRLVLHGVSVAVDSTTLLSDCAIVVGPKEKVALLGPNGSGKTTLLKTIYRSIRPTTGVILLGEDDLAKLRQREVARRTAVVAQEPLAEFDFRVEDVVSLGRAPHLGVLDRESQTDRDVVADSLERVGMLAHRRRPFFSLSGGEKQRTLVARALAQQTCLLLLDEPTNHLDVRATLEILELLRRLEISTLCVLHDLNLAAAYFDRIYVLAAGRIVTGGTPQEVLTPELVREVFGVDTHCLIHPATGRLLLAFSLISAVASQGCPAGRDATSAPEQTDARPVPITSSGDTPSPPDDR
ncbi:ABC transporter ATP-binding protein [Mycobacterium sp. SM1]|uniref:ABC transporter ATP-binding protein n=1 Tax=Mycobacterium sp. SM1 TaxID=2816243 RepID=UPI001BCCCE48|nr:ABC transporter ATP-binding protein [Mycobacterium sp. SM1]MBS4728323.1 ABC transporter ATP-binding protein [Mycobacterium sp. SM1]